MADNPLKLCEDLRELYAESNTEVSVIFKVSRNYVENSSYSINGPFGHAQGYALSSLMST